MAIKDRNIPKTAKYNYYLSKPRSADLLRPLGRLARSLGVAIPEMSVSSPLNKKVESEISFPHLEITHPAINNCNTK